MGRKRQLIIGCLVVATLGFVGILSYAPAWLPPRVTTALGTLEAVLPRRLLLVGVGGLLVVYGLRRRYTGRPRVRHEPLSTADDVDDSTPDLVGAAYTDTITQATAAAADGERLDEFTAVEPLRTAFIDLLVARGWPRDQATAYVETGRWTDNTTLAVFLGTDRAGDYPFWYRVYAWLLPERAFRQRVTATLDQLSAYATAAPGEQHQPPTESQFGDGDSPFSEDAPPAPSSESASAHPAADTDSAPSSEPASSPPTERA